MLGIIGFVIILLFGFIQGPVTDQESMTDPYGCTQCDVFEPGYDGPPLIYMEIEIPDDYYYDDYYYP